MGFLERWDRHNQDRSELLNERAGGDDWVEKMDADYPRPLATYHKWRNYAIGAAIFATFVVAVARFIIG